MAGPTNARSDERTNGWTHGRSHRTDGKSDGRTVGQIDVQRDEHCLGAIWKSFEHHLDMIWISLMNDSVIM